MFTRLFLNDVRQKALRKRVWYRALDRLERGIFSLAAQLIDEVKSELLGVELVKILDKLSDAMKSGFARHVESFGWVRLGEIREQLALLGSTLFNRLDKDDGFARYLAFLDWNQPPGWGSRRC